MTGTLLYLGLWDPARVGADLIAAVTDRLRSSGARLRPVNTENVLVDEDRALTAFGAPAQVEALPAESGGLAFVRIPVPDETPDEAWRPLLQAVRGLIAEVAPMLATVAVEEPPDALPDPTWAQASTLFGAGWVDLRQLSAEQRTSFQTLRDQGFATELGSGLWWSAKPTWSAEDEPEGLPRLALAAAVYEAWTGLAAPEPPRAPGMDRANAAQLWFWSAARDAAGLRDRVAAALPELLCWVAPGEDGWQPVIAQPAAPADLAILLGNLRSCLPQVGASWAGVQPTGGVAVPGFDPDIPATGVVVHPWVDRRWIGPDLSTLDDALAGSHREELAGGILYLTDPALDRETSADWADPDLRWDRLVRAAAILGQAAVRAASAGPSGWIGED